jgi:succinyl-CoA:acetate CoA-transferase
LTTFLIAEVAQDENLTSENVTLQPGAGPIAWALADRIREVPTNLGIWGEVAPTSWLPTLNENVRAITGAVAYTLPGERKFRNMLYNEFNQLKSKILLRPYEVTNNSELISRFRHIVIQQAIEIDIYGHVNVSHIGNDLYGGVGGSGDHTRSAYLTIIAMPSTTSSQQVSRIVPTVYHVDIPEHDVDVLVTEQGIADLRCLSPTERAKLIIEKCSSPKFKDRLQRYYEKILDIPGHQPVDLREALNFRDAE